MYIRNDCEIVKKLNGCEEFYKISKQCFKIYREAQTVAELCDYAIINVDGKISITDFEKEEIFGVDRINYFRKKYDETKSEEIYGGILVYGRNNEPQIKSFAKINKEGELKLIYEMLYM